MASFTPGPWTNGGAAKINLTFDSEANIFPPSAGPGEYQYGGPVAVVSVSEDAGGEANANLIAAAPDLLAVCEMVVARMHDNVYPGVRAAAIAALAKATGDQSCKSS